MGVKLPSGLWPSCWILVIAGTMVGFVYLAGLFSANVYADESRYLPAYRIPWFTESVIDSHMNYALHSDEYNDVVFLGASATLAGIVPNSLEQSTGLSAYNFGTAIDIGPDGHLEIFRGYLRGHPKPRLLVYTAFPGNLDDVNQTDAYFSPVRERFIQAYGTVLRTRETRVDRGPTFYFQEGYWWLRAMVNNGATHPFDIVRGARPSHRQVAPMLAQSRGYQQYPQSELIIKLGYLDNIRGVPASDWNDASLREMAELAKENDIGLMVWIMPIPIPNNPVGDDLVTAWTDEFRSAFPEVRVEGLPLQEYALDLWANRTHLSPSGAELLTETVGLKVVDFLAGREVG